MKRTRISSVALWLAVMLGVLAIPSAASTAPTLDTPQSTTAVAAILQYTTQGISASAPTLPMWSDPPPDFRMGYPYLGSARVIAGFPIPYGQNPDGSCTRGFKWRGGQNCIHAAVDFSSANGTDDIIVVAAHDGIASGYYNDQNCGQGIEIRADPKFNGVTPYATEYDHLSEIAGFKPGDRIIRGDILGKVKRASWPCASTYHLHFAFSWNDDQVRNDDDRVDPRPYLVDSSQFTLWDFRYGMQGWSIGNGLDNQRQEPQGMWFNVAGGDPQLFGPRISVPADKYPYLYLKMASKTDNGGQLYFMRQGDPGLSEERHVNLPIEADGVTREMFIDMRSNSNWTGNIVNVRLDPANDPVNEHWVRIEKLAFLRAPVPTGDICMQPLLRYYNQSTQKHFYTNDWNELGPGANGFEYEGYEGYTSKTASCFTFLFDRLYRLWHSGRNTYFYTADPAEVSSAQQQGFTMQGDVGYILTYSDTQRNTQPLYRYANTKPKYDDYLYTTNWNEHGAGGGDWRYEGIAAYVFRPPFALTVKADVPYGPRTLYLEIYEADSGRKIAGPLTLPLNEYGYATIDIPNLPARGYILRYRSSASLWKNRYELIQPGPNSIDLGTIDKVGDFIGTIDKVGNSIPDNVINIRDFSKLRYYIINHQYDSLYDLNRDGTVNILDFSRFKMNFGQMGDPIPIVVSGALAQQQNAPQSTEGLGSVWLTLDSPGPKPVSSEFTTTLSVSGGDYTLRGLDNIVRYDMCTEQFLSGTSLGAFSGLIFANDASNGIIQVRSQGINDTVSGAVDVATLHFKAIGAVSTTTLQVIDLQATLVDRSNLVSVADDGVDRLGSVQHLAVSIVGSPSRPSPNMVLDAPSGGVSRSSPFISVTVMTSDTCRGSNIKTVWLELFDQGSWRTISQDSDIADGWGRIVDLSQYPDGVYQLRARVEQQTYSQPSEQIQLVYPFGADKTFILDRIPPSGSTLTVTYAPESDIPAYRIEWGGATDNLSSPKYKVVYLIRGASSATYVWQSDVGPGSALFYPAEGQQYTFYVDAVDDAGNSESGLFGEYRGGWNIPWPSIYLPLVMRNYAPVRADFSAMPTSGVAPLTVAFTNSSTGNYTESLWDLGDGITSTAASPTHTYALTGTYTVTLTVSGASETNTLQRANYITVYDTSPCDDKIANGEFESVGAWEIDSGYPATYTTTIFHNGDHSMRAGILDPAANVKGLSAFRQTVTIPPHPQNATLRFWLYPTITGSTSDSDEQRVLLLDQLGNTVQALIKQRSNTRAWVPYEFDLTQYAGNTFKLYFGVYNNGSGSVTAMYVDDVSLQVCPVP